jgi:hypothetical protein
VPRVAASNGPPKPRSAKSPAAIRRRRVLSAAGEACLEATHAVTIALDAPFGTPTRDELVGWARDEAVAALKQVAADEFWNQFDPDLPDTVRVDVGEHDLDTVRGALLHLVSTGLTQVLRESGYQPPPEPWVLVGDVRRATTEATWGVEVDFVLLRRHLNRLITALTLLKVEGNDRDVRKQFSKAKVALSASQLMVAVGVAQLTGVLDDIRNEVVYPVVAHVWTELIIRPDDPQPNPEAVESAEAESREIRRKIDEALLRETEARAEVAEMKRGRMQERLKNKRLQPRTPLPPAPGRRSPNSE